MSKIKRKVRAPELRAEISRKHSEGMSARQIGFALGRSEATVRYHLERMGMCCHPLGLGNAIHSEAVALYQKGGTCRHLAKRFSVVPAAIRKWLKAAGVPLRNVATRTLALPEEAKTEAVRLYTDEQMPAREIARRLDSTHTQILKTLRATGCVRSRSEARACQLVRKPERHLRGRQMPWQSKKTGKWHFAQSSFEIVRMSQLDADESVLSWSRAHYRIPLPNGRRYVPDFEVTYADRSRVVEEVKPLRFKDSPEVQMKAAAAVRFLAPLDIAYRIVTEDDMGRDTIKRFNFEALPLLNEADRRERRRKANAEYHRRRKAAARRQPVR